LKQPITTTSGVATHFPLVDATRAGELLFACLHGVETISRHLQQRTPLSGRLQKLLDSKFCSVLNQLFGTSDEIPLLWRELPPRKTRPVGGARITPQPDRVLLIKAATPAAESPSAHCPDLNACTKKLSSLADGSDLAGRCVLCVGGRAALYPEYRRVVEAAGGSLLTYRGDRHGDADRLPTLLAHADALLCPVDCVDHEAYFAAKHYCKHSGKPCALLERSDLSTFRKGVKVLAASATRFPVIPFSNQRQASPPS